MAHWKNEFKKWVPKMKVFLMHKSNTNDYTNEQTILNAFLYANSIIITTYESARINANLLLCKEWGYIILDEGHKIRNPDADITQITKQFSSVHRLILTGAPVQNKLVELWSLFDFVYPGKLGTLPIFENEFCG